MVTGDRIGDMRVASGTGAGPGPFLPAGPQHEVTHELWREQYGRY